MHGSDHALDSERADILSEILDAHPDARIVAFAQYAETVSMLFSQLSASGGVAMLASRGGVVSGGRLTRDETLARFAPRALRVEAPPRAERIDVLLATDLLSEGVIFRTRMSCPSRFAMTAARMAQRVGRSRDSAQCIRGCTCTSSGHRRARRRCSGVSSRAEEMEGGKGAVGSSTSAPFSDAGNTEHRPLRARAFRRRPSDCVESSSDGAIRNQATNVPRREVAEALAASIRATCSGFIAAVTVDEKPVFLASISRCVSTDLDSQIAACLLCEGDDLETDRGDYQRAVNRIRGWFEHEIAAAFAGIGGSRSRARKRLLNRIDAAIERAPRTFASPSQLLLGRERSRRRDGGHSKQTNRSPTLLCLITNGNCRPACFEATSTRTHPATLTIMPCSCFARLAEAQMTASIPRAALPESIYLPICRLLDELFDDA